jgi:hypothetical protein
MLATLRNLAAAVAALGTMFVTTAAEAQDKGSFGEQGQFIFGADRLFGVFAYTSNSFSGVNGSTVTTNGTAMGLLWGGTSIYNGADAAGVFAAGNPNFYSAPRLGFDYTIIPHLTIGGELFVWFTPGQNVATNNNGTTVTNPAPTGNEFGIAPRVGYIFGVNDMLSIWLRGGFSYYLANFSSNGSLNNGCSSTASLDSFGIDLDPQLVISPVNHFAFTAGPALDWGFLGGWGTTANSCGNTPTVSGNYTAVNFSINGGMIGWF